MPVRLAAARALVKLAPLAKGEVAADLRKALEKALDDADAGVRLTATEAAANLPGEK